MTPDSLQVAGRIRQKIAQMVVEYQDQGNYLDLDGKRHTNVEGILNAWEELEQLGGT